MIDLEKLRARASGIPDSDGAIGPTWCTPTEVLELLDHIAQLEKDAGRLDWLETITKLNSEGSRTYGMETERNALFTIMPAWYQDKKRHENLRQSIDTAMEASNG